MQYKLPTLILKPATFHLGIKLLLTVTVDRVLKISELYIYVSCCIMPVKYITYHTQHCTEVS